MTVGVKGQSAESGEGGSGFQSKQEVMDAAGWGSAGGGGIMPGV